MAFPESFLQELKARNDITEIVSSYVSLKRRGRNMVGLCPFHSEKTPSFAPAVNAPPYLFTIMRMLRVPKP